MNEETDEPAFSSVLDTPRLPHQDFRAFGPVMQGLTLMLPRKSSPRFGIELEQETAVTRTEDMELACAGSMLIGANF